MLDFCPYESTDKDFFKIDINNLAYEIQFFTGYHLDTLKYTVIGNNYTEYIVKNTRANIIFHDQSIHYILRPKTKQNVSGLEQLQAAISSGNRELHQKKIETTETKQDKRNEIFGGEAGSTASIYEETEKIGLECDLDEATGQYIICSSMDSRWGKQRIMKAVPCCPNCFMPLPVGWLAADEFYPVSLMGKKSEGKTTYLLSLMGNDWEALTSLDSGWIISPAHEDMEERLQGQEKEATDPSRGYEWMKEASVRMIVKGQCPPPTPLGFPIKPIFLNIITPDGHSLIVGMYDNSGENLEAMSPTNPMMLLLACMKAHIYFIDPSRTMIPVEMKETENTEDAGWKETALMTLEKQGQLQTRKQGEPPILAEDLLRVKPSAKSSTEKKNKKYGNDPFQILRRYQKLLVNMRVVDRMKEQKIYVTLTKCDLLENIPEIKDENYSDILFQRGNQTTLFKDQKLAREEVIKKIFDSYVFTDPSKEKFLSRNLKSFSYHCISALGCATVKRIENGKPVEYLSEEYDPIRVAEPIAYCIKEKIDELGWEQEDF